MTTTPANSINQKQPGMTVFSGSVFDGASLAHAGSSVSFSGASPNVYFELTDANNSTFLGLNSGNSSISGLSNTAVGVGTGVSLDTGYANSFFGLNAGLSATSAHDCVLIGLDAAVDLLTGNNVICIGSNSGSSFVGGESNNICIGNSGTTQSDTIWIGTSQTSAYMAGIYGNQLSTGRFVRVGIDGELSGTQLVSSNSSITIDNGFLAGQVNLTIGSIGTALTINTDTSSITSLGGQLNFHSTGYGKTVVCDGQPTNNISFRLGNNANGSMQIGFNSGQHVSGDGFNTALGYQSAAAMISSQWSTMVGALSGLNYLGSYASFLGAYAGAGISTGSNSVSIGYQSMYGGGSAVLTGDNNIAIGYQAAINYTSSEDSNICIANPGTAGDSHKLIIGIDGSGSQQQNYCQIAGILGASVSNQKVVVINSSTGQLGDATLTSSNSSITIGVSTPGTINLTVASIGSGLTIHSDSGNAVSSSGALTFAGAHGLNSSATGSTVTYAVNNTLTLGDLSTVAAGSNALVLTTGDLNLVSGSIKLPAFNDALAAGIIDIGGTRAIWTDRGNWFSGAGTSSALTITGNANTTLGVNSAHALNLSSNGVFLGYAAGFRADGGDNLTCIGARALVNALTSSHIIAIGALAGNNYTSSESNCIVIGSAGVNAESGVIRIGTDTIQTTAYMSGIRNTTLSTGNLVRVGTDGQLSSAILTSNDSSVTIDNTTTAGQIDLSVANIGSGLVVSTDTLQIASVGGIIEMFASSNGKTVVCDGVLPNFIEIKLGNSANGSIQIGLGSGASVSGDGFNTCLGYQSAAAMITSQWSTMVGALSGTNYLGNYGAFFGAYAGAGISTGDGSVSIGYQSMYGGGSAILTGSYNIAIGYQSGLNYASSEDSNICIGNQGTALDSNKIIIGTDGSGSQQQNYCQIAGINGATISSTSIVAIDTTSGQLAASVLSSSDSSITIDVTTPGTIDLTVASGATGITWSEITTDTSVSQNSGYLVLANAILTLPSSPSVASGTITVIAATTDIVVIQASGGKVIQMGTVSSSTNGSWSNSQPGDSMTLAYSVTNGTWYAFADQGSWTSA